MLNMLTGLYNCPNPKSYFSYKVALLGHISSFVCGTTPELFDWFIIAIIGFMVI